MKTQNRPLTQEELEIAWSLDWKPTRYTTMRHFVRFENEERYQMLFPDGELSSVYEDSKIINTLPIPQKPFDIESVEWSDNDVMKVSYDDGKIFTEFYDSSLGFYETKQDIINKARALGVTPEDLK